MEHQSEMLQMCRDIANDLCITHGREVALEISSMRYHSAEKWWQRTNWRMIRRLINVRVQSPCPDDSIFYRGRINRGLIHG